MKVGIRVSLRAFLCALLVVGVALGLLGRYWFHDSARVIRTDLSDGTTALVYFQSSRPDTPPAYLVLVPFLSMVAIDINTNRKEAQASVEGKMVRCDLIAVAPSGMLEFNGEPVPVRSTRRVFVYSTEGQLVPLDIEDQDLVDVQFPTVRTLAGTKVYREMICTCS